MEQHNLSGSINVTIEVNGDSIELYDVDFEGWYEYDRGFYSYSNGDPGESPLSDGDVNTTWDQRKIESEVLFWLGARPANWDEIADGLESKINEALSDVVLDVDVERYFSE